MRRPARPTTLVLQSLAVLLAAGLLLGGCASGGGSDSGSQTSTESSSAAPAKPKGVAPPSGHPMGKIEMKMRPDQVRKIMGEPDSVHAYPGAIWKNFIPFYYGADSGNRVEYGYAGRGRVVFATNRWSGQESVVRVDYDPNEDGQ